MVRIGTGRDDPRAWVRAAYLLLDAAESARPGDKLPSQPYVMAKIGVSVTSVRHACQELARLGLVHLVAGHGYFPGNQPG